MSTGEVVKNRYEDILSFEKGADERERLQKEAEFLAFYSHIEALGRVQNVSPNLVKGNTKISVPAYFRLEGHGNNPVNNAALELLPGYSYSPGYGDSTETHVDNSGLRSALSLPESEVEAARKGKASGFVVAKALGLLDPVGAEAIRGVTKGYIHGSTWTPHQNSLYDTSFFVRDVSRDLNERIVEDVSDIAKRVETRGYVDFLDYLVDVKEVLAERVETIFAHEAPAVK